MQATRQRSCDVVGSMHVNINGYLSFCVSINSDRVPPTLSWRVGGVGIGVDIHLIKVLNLTKMQVGVVLLALDCPWRLHQYRAFSAASVRWGLSPSWRPSIRRRHFFYIRHVNSPFRIAGRLASPSLSEDVRKGGTKNALCVQDVDCILDNSKYANNEKCVNLIQNESKLAAVENIAGRRPTTITATTSSTFPKIPQCNFLSLFRERYVAKKKSTVGFIFWRRRET